MAIFVGSASGREGAEKIVTLGRYLPNKSLLSAHGEKRFHEERTAYDPLGDEAAARLAADIAFTRLVDALTRGRKWPIDRLVKRLDPILSPGIGVVVVPGHTPFGDDPPIRILARRLADLSERIDLTDVLSRHTPIQKITFGGPSYPSLHRQTIAVSDSERLIGQRILLLDDLARSGASLRTCQALILEAGAAEVQMLALGRIV